MKVIKTYIIEVEINEDEIANTFDETVKEFGNIEEYVKMYVDNSIVCHCDDEKLFKDIHIKKELSLA